MISLKKRQSGFTIVELLIVIVVIGILAALVITTYSGIQAKARNSERQTDVQSVQTQIEAYFSQNGFYPSLTNLNLDTFRSAEMKSLDIGALTDPSAPNSSSVVVAAPQAKAYSYAPLNSAGTTCEADQTTCSQYTLVGTYEGTVNGQTTYTKKNLD